MKIKCVSRDAIAFGGKDSSSARLKYEFLDIGSEYNVYGMIVYHGQLSYYICDRVHTRFPVAIPLHHFEIINSNLSRYWIFGIIEGVEKFPLWTFPEWINEPYFFDGLTDQEEREVSIFKAYKELMGVEFPDPSITELALVGDSEWLICPDCMDAWNSPGDKDGMVICPKCKKMMHNPRHTAKKMEP